MTDKRPDFPKDGFEAERLAEFANLFAGLAEASSQIRYSEHPDHEALRAYVTNQLPEDPMAGRAGPAFRNEQDFRAFLSGRPARWTRQFVSMHIVTCRKCERRVQQLRESQERVFTWIRKPAADLWRRSWPVAIKAAATLAAIAALLWLVSIESPPPSGGGAPVMMVYNGPSSRF